MNQTIDHIQGKILVFGGVYSNLHALQALQQFAQTEGILPNNIICTGDIVAYCAYPSECLDFIEAWGIHAIAGNVELNLLNQADDCGCNFNAGSRCDVFSRQWYPYAKSAMSKHNLAYLATLPHHLSFNYGSKRVKVVHGTPEEVSGYVFKSTPWAIKQTILKQSKADVILGGHCGLPFVDCHKELYWINAGVIGMPANDGGSHTWFATLDEESDAKLKVEFHQLVYTHDLAAKAMLEQGLPSTYSATLQSGIWDNCEILPAEETRLRGQKLQFNPEPLDMQHQ